MFSRLTLVLGGASSGKTAYAEKLALSAGGRPVYLATGEAHDAEMAEKIENHKRARNRSWTTAEAPLETAEFLATAAEGQTVLLDCATMWLSNQLMAGRNIESETEKLLRALASCPARLIVVSNETGLGIVPENALARRFREQQGRLNQRLATLADRVILVAAGLPLALKGDLPEVQP